jgi:DNA-binding transcriptional regulator YiaG
MIARIGDRSEEGRMNDRIRGSAEGKKVMSARTNANVSRKKFATVFAASRVSALTKMMMTIEQ